MLFYLFFQMLSMMDAQAQLFQHGHQSLSELDEYRRKMSDEVTARFGCSEQSPGSGGCCCLASESMNKIVDYVYYSYWFWAKLQEQLHSSGSLLLSSVLL